MASISQDTETALADVEPTRTSGSRIDRAGWDDVAGGVEQAQNVLLLHFLDVFVSRRLVIWL